MIVYEHFDFFRCFILIPGSFGDVLGIQNQCFDIEKSKFYEKSNYFFEPKIDFSIKKKRIGTGIESEPERTGTGPNWNRPNRNRTQTNRGNPEEVEPEPAIGTSMNRNWYILAWTSTC